MRDRNPGVRFTAAGDAESLGLPGPLVEDRLGAGAAAALPVVIHEYVFLPKRPAPPDNMCEAVALADLC